MKSTFFYSASALAALIAMGAAGSASAQGAAAQPAQAANQPHSIDELVVTAQRREQNLQDVPIVVTTVNAQQLQDAGVRDIKDLTIVTPGLTVTTTSNAAITSARAWPRSRGGRVVNGGRVRASSSPALRDRAACRRSRAAALAGRPWGASVIRPAYRGAAGKQRNRPPRTPRSPRGQRLPWCPLCPWWS